MKVIFLDFDGVITTPLKWKMNAKNIWCVKKIIDNTDAKIVVSSSWRYKTLEATKNRILSWKRRCPHNKSVLWLVDNLYDQTSFGGSRGYEIQRWLDIHEVEDYVIIDDEGTMLDSQLFHFVQIYNWEYGITSTEADVAIKLLNHEFIQDWLALNFDIRNRWTNKCRGIKPDDYDKLREYENEFKRTHKLECEIDK